MNRFSFSIFSFIISASIAWANSKALNPIQFGLLKAQTPAERYSILYQTHCEAKRLGRAVSYKGIRSIEVEVPNNAKSIPLTYKTDFNDVSIIVTNNSSDMFMFEMSDEIVPIIVTKEQIDNGDFTDIPELMGDGCLLVLEDETPWVKERIGYNYPVIRRDILLITKAI